MELVMKCKIPCRKQFETAFFMQFVACVRTLQEKQSRCFESLIGAYALVSMFK